MIKKCLKEDSESMKLLYDLYAPQMLSVCHRYVNNSDEAKEIFQEGFYLVFKNLKQLKNPEALSGWIKQIFVNSSLNYIKKQKKLYVVSEINEGIEFAFNGNIIEDISADEIIELIKDLPIGYRTVFNLYAIEGYSHKEIAQRLGISVGTSKSQLFDARRMLKKNLARLEKRVELVG